MSTETIAQVEQYVVGTPDHQEIVGRLERRGGVAGYTLIVERQAEPAFGTRKLVADHVAWLFNDQGEAQRAFGALDGLIARRAGAGPGVNQEEPDSMSTPTIAEYVAATPADQSLRSRLYRNADGYEVSVERWRPGRVSQYAGHEVWKFTSRTDALEAFELLEKLIAERGRARTNRDVLESLDAGTRLEWGDRADATLVRFMRPRDRTRVVLSFRIPGRLEDPCPDPAGLAELLRAGLEFLRKSRP